MASSNRNWPSMFKSKPYNTNHQWQHGINHPGWNRSPYSSVPGCEERSPEPKPRWNPKPEQIRILEAIFNSGMVNPPRDEIRKIRAQLQEYGQVGDANVFYWFQNRKSRSKHKLRHFQTLKNHSSQPQTSPPITDKTYPKPLNKTSELSNPPQTYFHTHSEFLPEPFFFPPSVAFTQGICFSELSNMADQHQVPDYGNVGPCTSLLLSELINHDGSKKDSEEKFIAKIQPQLMTYPTLTTPSTTVSPHNISTAGTVPSPINQVQGLFEASGGQGIGVKSTVFINDVVFEVPSEPLNIREAFGDDAVLIHSSGQPVLTNEWGTTLQVLNHGSSYYLI